MPKFRSLGELFEKQKTLIKNQDKVQNLKDNDSPALRYLLKLAHAKLDWTVPEGAPPYKQDPGALGLTPSNLIREMRTLYIYLPGGSETLTQMRREQLFQQLLERLHVSEVELLVSLKDKSLPTKYRVPRAVVDTAFPGLLDEPVNIRFLR